MANESIGLMTNFTLSGISNFILNWAPNESTQRQGALAMVRIEENAIVRRGYLEGIPPVARIYPSLQLSYFLGNDGNDVAVKSPHEQATHANREEFLAEIEFMKQLPFHPHILSLVGCSTNPDYPLIVTGICELGALLSLLRQMDPEHLKYEESPLEFDDLVPIGWQISDALVFLSAKEIVHRDVAARNVLVTKDKTAKLSDFGLCRFQKDMVAGVRDGKFPIKWMAPEAIEFADFSPECDV
ncbi:unnamed protein product, partial [Mesorhabditis belari]|uniref:Protein kinase domain-containing protein n=1 Tax=Mesorhabditis belari TaxID=2138241 RepID=A0AAF3EPB9_9BILA